MTLPLRHPRWIVFSLFLVLLLWAGAVQAAVRINFYSKEFGTSFPHAFVSLEGVDKRTGKKIDVNYGFTAKTISPAILMGSVTGEIMAVDKKYIEGSDRHFSFELTDAEYDRVLKTVDKWHTMKQPSYNLNRQNCVYFVADVAATLGMKVETPKELMKKPRSYTEFLAKANHGWLTARKANLNTRYLQAAQ